jgi:hypothetical protein
MDNNRIIRLSDVTDQDVICGRGFFGQHFRGNRWMHHLIDTRREEYNSSTKKQKAGITMAVVQSLKVVHGARFLSKSHTSSTNNRIRGRAIDDSRMDVEDYVISNNEEEEGATEDDTNFIFEHVTDKVASEKVSHAFRCKHRNRIVQSSKHVRMRELEEAAAADAYTNDTTSSSIRSTIQRLSSSSTYDSPVERRAMLDNNNGEHASPSEQDFTSHQMNLRSTLGKPNETKSGGLHPEEDCQHQATTTNVALASHDQNQYQDEGVRMPTRDQDHSASEQESLIESVTPLSTLLTHNHRLQQERQEQLHEQQITFAETSDFMQSIQLFQQQQELQQQQHHLLWRRTSLLLQNLSDASAFILPAPPPFPTSPALPPPTFTTSLSTHGRMVSVPFLYGNLLSQSSTLIEQQSRIQLFNLLRLQQQQQPLLMPSVSAVAPASFHSSLTSSAAGDVLSTMVQQQQLQQHQQQLHRRRTIQQQQQQQGDNAAQQPTIQTRILLNLLLTNAINHNTNTNTRM